ncbi:acid phosphatase [Streptomyces cinnamoneus]|uniref:Acid phosphatase n=1 Tax=Streptomyces cinnamoneus TaxID=53446 RepID=A0A2G1XFV0_STRCJ|nr:HAD family acid phosphatase [Streptomyces cinnamoneus]PHQ50114.1 acid phosphatase [Streptomyces cinnamoneus]PPT13105.1 acid phosphatase [Streptomyces cinnamoneus]
MSSPSPKSKRLRVAAAVAAVAAGAGLYTAGAATAEHSVPRSDKEIPNLTQVQDKIKAYYGDTVDASGQHYASADGNYAKQVAGIEKKAKAQLEKVVKSKNHKGGKPAIVLDLDDTTLLTYNYELQQGFHFTPESQDAYLKSTDMAPVFGMPTLVNWAQSKGIEVFYVTGRGEHQREWSARNLKNVGYKPVADTTHFFLKNKQNPPAYLPCGAKCTTVEYKAGTRKYIESKGFDIVANFGDQYSDLQGGHADRTYKMPNPMYYLP